MSCILRISGESLDIDSLLAQHSLIADRAWKKGEPYFLKGRFNSDSGANFIASNADLDEFDLQVTEATEFLGLHRSEIARIVAFPGAQDAVLDFGVALYEGYVALVLSLPPRLIQLAASAGVGVEISHYPCSRDDEES